MAREDMSWVGQMGEAARNAGAAIREELQSPEARQGLAEGIGTRGVVHAFWERLKEAPEEIGMELRRLGVQGGMEIAAALYSGQANSFVPYGPGQWRGPEREGGQGIHGQQGVEEPGIFGQEMPRDVAQERQHERDENQEPKRLQQRGREI